MVEPDQMTKQSTDEQSISTSRRSVLSTVGAGVAALGVGIGSTGSVTAASGTPLPLKPSEWRLVRGSQNEMSISSEEGTVNFSYATEYKSTDPMREYQLYATVTKAGEFDLDWNYSGHHGQLGTSAGATITIYDSSFRTRRELTLVDTVNGNQSADGNFEFIGSETISVEKGDKIGVDLSGSDGDDTDNFNGELSLTPKTGDTGQGSSQGSTSPKAISHAADSWNSSGPGNHNISGGGNNVEFTYDGNDYWWETWDYETTAQSNATLDVNWSYEGNHSWYWAAAEAYVQVNGNRQRLVEEGTNGNFSTSGKTQISVNKGDTVRVILKGRHFDWSRIKEGRFSVSFSETGDSPPADDKVPELIDHKADSWKSAGPDKHKVNDKSRSVQSAGTGSIELVYGTGGTGSKMWTYKTTAQSDADLKLDWSYGANHGYFATEANAYIEVNGQRTTLIEAGGREVAKGFGAEGRDRISVSEGDTVRVILEGGTYSRGGMDGSLSVTFFKP